MDSEPEIFGGGRSGQQRTVHQTEGVQDFRRKQEGHLIIADDRPLLVMSFGTKFQGANPAKYKIEGKYDIPVGYKVIIKWDDDEIVFMTRQGSRGFGPEFQIVYLPKSPVPEDFTMFEWNPNIAEIWDQFLKVVESHEDRDLRMFNQGPWLTFGVTRDEVQIALKQTADDKTIIDGILYCADGTTPNLQEYMRYLGFDPATDANYLWICEALRSEPKPPNFFQYISEGRVYWVDSGTNDPTWKHPHYDKYRNMLQAARLQKPVSHWKTIIAFRIEYLLSSIFTWEVEEEVQNGGEYPLVETVQNVLEMERIFGIDIKNEPYLVHVLRRALRHYANAVKEKRKVTDVSDFLDLMQRFKDVVDQYEQMREEELMRFAKSKVCSHCKVVDAVLFCNDCGDFFCQGCFDKLHATGRRRNHQVTWVDTGRCSECGVPAVYHCIQCGDLFCRDCFQEFHARGGRRNHIPIILRSFASEAHKIPSAAGMVKNLGAEKVLAQARSPWLAFYDENNIKFYYNVHTNESRRDMPLAPVNEPIEDHRGGGLAASWAGTYGANMFEDPLDPSSQRVGIVKQPEMTKVC